MRMTRLTRELTGATLGALLLSAPVLGQETTLVSVDSSGVEAAGSSSGGSISENGRFVAFFGFAANLVPGDTNGFQDVFVHDRQNATTERVSVATGGAEGDADSFHSAISADGRFVAFHSYASNLVAGDTNGFGDVFVRDRQSGTTERVSVASGGAEGNSHSNLSLPSISADGRFVAFASLASNLVAGDTNGSQDVFVHDRQSATTERVSVATGGVQVNFGGDGASISADGRFVAFKSNGSGLVPGDTNGFTDAFVHDRQTAVTARVSVDSSGVQGNANCDWPSLSADGRCVAFQSSATNLVVGDTNGRTDVFVHDRQSGTTERVSLDSSGAQGDGSSFAAVSGIISADGRFVAFYSTATNLVLGDANGHIDAFVHDRQSGTTELVSRATGGAQGNSDSYSDSISADGRFVVFEGRASNLVANDTNFSFDVFVHERGCPLASATFRNAGSNPASYACIAPVLGTSWSGTVDLSTTGHSSAYLLVSATPASATLGGGQVLLGTGWVDALGPVSGPLASFAFAMPSDVALCGQRFTTQAVHLGTLRPFALSNAMDLVLGQ